MRLKASPSINVTKTNTLHQFDVADIIGVKSPVGKVPIVFYVKDTCNSGRKGIIYFGDRDSVCYMYPETAHAEWCKQPYDLKYDELEPWDNGTEHGWRRKYGVLNLWVTVCRKWYNGHVMYRPKLKIQGCKEEPCSEEKVETTIRKRSPYQPAQQKTVKHCRCN